MWHFLMSHLRRGRDLKFCIWIFILGFIYWKDCPFPIIFLESLFKVYWQHFSLSPLTFYIYLHLYNTLLLCAQGYRLFDRLVKWFLYCFCISCLWIYQFVVLLFHPGVIIYYVFQFCDHFYPIVWAETPLTSIMSPSYSFL